MTNYLEILSDDKIQSLKNNSEEVHDLLKANDTNKWLKNFFKEENVFEKSNILSTEFQLIKTTDGEEINKYDLDNAIMLHKNLKLDDCRASDNRLWISLCFGMFYDYMKSRWSMDKKLNLTEHWFIPHGQKRGLYFNGIARLYWCARVSYDSSLEDPYELTRFCFKDINIITQMIFRSWSNSKTIRLAFIKALKKHVDDGGTYNRDLLTKILKYISFFGGAYMLDCFTEKELFDKFLLKIKEYSCESNSQKFKL